MKKTFLNIIAVAAAFALALTFTACPNPNTGIEVKPGEENKDPVVTDSIKGTKDSSSTESVIVFKTNDGTEFTFNQYAQSVAYAKNAREADEAIAEDGEDVAVSDKAEGSEDSTPTDDTPPVGASEEPSSTDSTDTSAELGGTWTCKYKGTENYYAGYYTGDAKKVGVKLNLTIEKFKDEPVAGKVSFDFEIAEDETFTVKTIPSVTVKTKFTVTFDTDGGNAVEAMKVYDGEPVARPDVEITKEGLTFADWYADKECTTLYDFTKPVTADVTIYAKWVNMPVFTITYVSESPALNIVKKIPEGAALHVLPESARKLTESGKRYSVAGYYYDKEMTNEIKVSSYSSDFSEIYPDADMTVYVKFVEEEKITISFEHSIYNAPEEPAAIESISIYPGETIEIPEITPIEGYYYTFKKGSSEIDVTQPFTWNTKITVSWEKATKVLFKKGDADNIFIEDKILEDDFMYVKKMTYVGYSLPDSERKNGYTLLSARAEKAGFYFNGWIVKEGGKATIGSTAYDGLVLTPSFVEEKKCTITFTISEKAGITPPDPIELTIGEQIPPLPYIEIGNGLDLYFNYWCDKYGKKIEPGIITKDITVEPDVSKTKREIILTNEVAGLPEKTFIVGDKFYGYSDIFTPYEVDVGNKHFYYWAKNEDQDEFKKLYENLAYSTSTIKLYPVYTRTIKINYETEYGTAPDSIEIDTKNKLEKEILTLPDYIDENYNRTVMDGWYIKNADGTLGNKVETTWNRLTREENFAGDEITLVAKWVKAGVNVTFINEYHSGYVYKNEVTVSEGTVLTAGFINGNSGNVSDIFEGEIGGVKTTKYFDGWTIKGTNEVAENYVVGKEDIVVYAKYCDGISGTITADYEKCDAEKGIYKFLGDKIKFSVNYQAEGSSSAAPLENGNVRLYKLEADDSGNQSRILIETQKVQNGEVTFDTSKFSIEYPEDTFEIAYKNLSAEISFNYLFSKDERYNLGSTRRFFSNFFVGDDPHGLWSSASAKASTTADLDTDLSTSKPVIYYVQDDGTPTLLDDSMEGREHVTPVIQGNKPADTYMLLEDTYKNVSAAYSFEDSDKHDYRGCNLYFMQKKEDGSYSKTLVCTGFIAGIADEGVWFHQELKNDGTRNLYLMYKDSSIISNNTISLHSISQTK